MPSLVGHNIERYQIVEQLGQGGMAIVYRGIDTRLKRDVAIKVIRNEAIPADQIPQMLKRFEREATALAQLDHPNIVKVYDFGEFEGSPYLVMQFVRGGSLQPQPGRPMPPADAARLLLPVAHALEYAHQNKLVHRDVKPSNILISADGRPMLSDFGIAKILESEGEASLTGAVGIGTPEYMSPEQSLARGVDQRTDIYALGVVLYQLVTGRKPFQADTPMAVVLKHLNDPLPDPRTYIPGLPDEVVAAIFTALAKDPAARYQNMHAFAQALEQCCSPAKPTNDISTRITPPQAAAAATPNADIPTLNVPVRVAQISAAIEQAMKNGAWGQVNSLMRDLASLGEDGQAEAARLTVLAMRLQDSLTHAGPPPTPPASGQPPAPPPTPPPHFPPGPRPAPRRRSFPTWAIVSIIAAVFVCVLIVAGLLILNSFKPQIKTSPGVPTLQTATGVQSLSPEAPDLFLSATETRPAPVTATSPAITGTHPVQANPLGQIIFTCQVSKDETRDQICLVNANGSGYTQITNDASENFYPSISPDGAYAIYVSNRNGYFEIYETSLFTGQTNQISDMAGHAYAPEVSPDGTSIVFTHQYEGEKQAIWIIGRDGSAPRPLFDPAEREGWDPSWSSSGSSILFASYASNKSVQLFIVNADGSDIRQVSNLGGLRGRSSISPDGLTAATYAGVKPNRHIYLIPLDGGNPFAITGAADNVAPDFSPDGNWITFMSYRAHPGDSNGCEIFIMRTDGSDVRQLTANDYCDWQPRWEP